MAKDKAKAEAAEAEAPEGDEGEAPAAEVKKKPSLKMLLVVGSGALVVLGGGGTGAVMLLGGKGGDHAHKPKKKIAKADGKKGEKGSASPITEGPDGVLFYTMPDLTVNMQATDGRPTFLKLKLAFEVPDQDAAEAIEPNAPRLNDMFQTFLRELRPEDLSGSQGSYQLRMEILRRVNLVIAPAKVNAVLIQEMLIQ
jgi:flagellar FliL protein